MLNSRQAEMFYTIQKNHLCIFLLKRFTHLFFPIGITTIGLLADTLVGGAGEKADVRHKMLTDIRTETATLTQLVQEMRDLSLI